MNILVFLEEMCKFGHLNAPSSTSTCRLMSLMSLPTVSELLGGGGGEGGGGGGGTGGGKF
jgi:hypothetical protein